MVRLSLLDVDQLKNIQDGNLEYLPWDCEGFEMTRYIRKTYGKRILQVSKKAGLEGWFSFWAIVSDNHLCGLIGFKGYNPVFPEVEVHYAINPRDQKKGFASLALKELLNWAFNEDPNITVFARHVRHGNTGSKKVLENCGFSLYKTYESFSTYTLKFEIMN